MVMGDYAKAAVGFGHVYVSLWIAVWMETDDDEERQGKLICTWFTLFYSRYALSKLVGESEFDYTHCEAMYYWYALMLHTLWRKAYYLHDEYQIRTCLITFHLFICSVVVNYLISLEYDRYDTEILWSNGERARDAKPFFEYLSFVFLLTYVLLLNRFYRSVFLLWILMHSDILLNLLKSDVKLRENLFGEITKMHSNILQRL